MGTRPEGPSARLFRRIRFGRLARFSLLDTRQSRTDQPACSPLQGEIKFACPDALADQQTLPEPTQERWLLHGLKRSDAQWNVIAQQVMMTRWDLGLGLVRAGAIPPGSPPAARLRDVRDHPPVLAHRLPHRLDDPGTRRLRLHGGVVRGGGWRSRRVTAVRR